MTVICARAPSRPIDLTWPTAHKPPDAHSTVHYNYSHRPIPHFVVLVDSNYVKAVDRLDQMIPQIVNFDLEVVGYSHRRIDDGCYYA